MSRSMNGLKIQQVSLHLFGKLVGYQKTTDILSLITLQLDNLAQLWTFHNGAVATEFCIQPTEDEQKA
jgi:hypothetical protein